MSKIVNGELVCKALDKAQARVVLAVLPTGDVCVVGVPRANELSGVLGARAVPIARLGSAPAQAVGAWSVDTLELKSMLMQSENCELSSDVLGRQWLAFDAAGVASVQLSSPDGQADWSVFGLVPDPQRWTPVRMLKNHPREGVDTEVWPSGAAVMHVRRAARDDSVLVWQAGAGSNYALCAALAKAVTAADLEEMALTCDEQGRYDEQEQKHEKKGRAVSRKTNKAADEVAKVEQAAAGEDGESQAQEQAPMQQPQLPMEGLPPEEAQPSRPQRERDDIDAAIEARDAEALKRIHDEACAASAAGQSRQRRAMAGMLRVLAATVKSLDKGSKDVEKQIYERGYQDAQKKIMRAIAEAQ